MTATLKFDNREDAERFAGAWARYSKRGHIIGSGMHNVEVIVHDVTKEDKEWIDDYIKKVLM